MTVWLEHCASSPPLCFLLPPASYSYNFIVPGHKLPAQTVHQGDSRSFFMLNFLFPRTGCANELGNPSHHPSSPQVSLYMNLARSSRWSPLTSLLDLTAGRKIQRLTEFLSTETSLQFKKKKKREIKGKTFQFTEHFHSQSLHFLIKKCSKFCSGLCFRHAAVEEVLGVFFVPKMIMFMQP